MSSNFDFLQPNWATLYDDARQTEQNIFAAPRTCAFYARRALERMVGAAFPGDPRLVEEARSLLLSRRASRLQRAGTWAGTGILFAVTSTSMLAVLFIFFFIARDAIPFFRLRGFAEFFTSTRWYPSSAEAEFGALAKDYVRQRTLEPAKALGRAAGLGFAAAFLFTLAALFLAVAGMRSIEYALPDGVIWEGFARVLAAFGLFFVVGLVAWRASK